MKILVVIPNLQRGGAERVVSLLTMEWAKTHEVITAVFDGRDLAYASGGRLVDLGRPPEGGPLARTARMFSRARLLRRLISRESPDCIFSFLEIANFPTIAACAASGTLSRLTVSVRNNPVHFPAGQRIPLPVLYRLPRAVVAVSAGVARKLETDFHVPGRRIFVVPNPIDLRLIEAGCRETPPTGALPAQRRFILGVGRLDRQKGFDLLIDAYSRMSPRMDVDLVILGEGPHRSALEELVRKLDLAGRVFLPGAVANPFAFMARAQVFVLSSRWEGWPNVLVEAMATGAAVAAFDCPYGPSEIVEDRVTGAVVAAQDTEALARVLEKLLADDDLRARLGQRAQEAIRRFSVESVASKWTGLVHGR